MGNEASMTVETKMKKLGKNAAPPKHVFGPVSSRRLGMSLGIDPIPPKTCNWNCVYCQLGRTVPLEKDRAEYLPTEEILEEVERQLSVLDTGGIRLGDLCGIGRAPSSCQHWRAH